MATYTLVHYEEVPPQHFGQKPEQVDIRFYRNQLGMTGGGLTVMKLGPGAASNVHKHKKQEETYLLISGDAEIKLNDEILKLQQYDAVRVAKETNRALRNIGNEEAIIIAFGTPNTGPGDAIDIDNFWH